MSEPNRDKENLVITLKIGVFMTVLGWMVLAIEAPKLTSAPDVNVTPAKVAHSAPAGNAPDSALTTAPRATDPVPSTAPKAAETAPVAEQPSADAAVQPTAAPTPVPPTPPAEGDKP